MSDLDWGEDEKIPFDYEPIERKPAREYNREIKRKQKESATSKSRNWAYVLAALLFCAFAIMGYALVNVSAQIEKLKSERTNYTMNIASTDGNTSYAAAKGMLSTVSISASTTNNGGTAENFFHDAMASRGSGVILEVNKLTGDAYILTNYHVVCSTATLSAFAYHWVLLWDSVTPIPATYVGGSSQYDVAVLKIEDSMEIMNSTCTAVTIGNSLKLTVGEPVVAIGNSMARNLRITTGVVSVEEELMGTSNYNMYISHSADVNSGNSGGGLYNANGELIGIVNAKFRDVNETSGVLIYREVIHGMNYAIPSEMAVSIAKNIIRNNGTLKKPSIGLVLGNNVSYSNKFYNLTQDGYGYTTYNLYITKSTGSFWTNDKLISVSYEYGGETKTVQLDRLFALESIMYNLDKRSNITFVVERKGAEKTINMTIETVTSVS